MSEALPLPARPNLEHYKKVAKEFQQALKTDAGIAPLLRGQFPEDADRIERRWEQVQQQNERAAQGTLAGVQFFLAREHGFASWPKFARHLEAVARDESPVSNFEAAVDAIVSGDATALRRLVQAQPDLVRQRSTRAHRSTLLHYVSANGVEDYRQKTPPNIVEITEQLLDAGADVNAESDAYGGGSTALGLVATSVHPERAGVQIALLEVLLARGAYIDHPSAAGKGLSIVKGCLANGQPKAAEFLARAGAHVDLEGAAGCGLIDVVKSSFDRSAAQEVESGFRYACCYGRVEVVEFLLDHGVDPGLSSDTGQTGLHAAAYGAQAGVVKLLLERGAQVDARDYSFRATPLEVALHVWEHSPDRAERCYEVIALLVRAGAKPDTVRWDDPAEGWPDLTDKIRSNPRMQAALRGERSR